MRGLPPYFARLLKLCRNRGASLEDAWDIVQDAHLRFFAYRQSAIVKDAGSLLRRIVLHLSINHFHRELSVPFMFESFYRCDRLGMLIDSAPGPERTVDAEQELDWVVSLLSAASRRTCQMFIAQRGGYTYEEIASAFAIKPRTVEKHVTLSTDMLEEAEYETLRQSIRRPSVTMVIAERCSRRGSVDPLE
ncbi:MAG TPA: sigma-70 family RNA polymerase sigma factor [Steroidobacteraceae bacterium]|nr:sigma-70 family RNA polymerase sigma factor [Steroidobacteraceae bacterium]